MSELHEYTLRWRGREEGPLTLEDINRRLDDHEIGMGHEIYFDDQWMTLEAFFAALEKPDPAPEPIQAPIPPPLPAHLLPATPSFPRAGEIPVPQLRIDVARMNPPSRKKPRHRLLFGLLAVLFGFTGLHNFYARQWLTGLLQFLLSIATYLLGFGVIAAWVWAMVEAIVVRHDGDGIEMN